VLFDRNGLPLVDNRPAFTLSLIRRIDDRAGPQPRVGPAQDPVCGAYDALGRVLATRHAGPRPPRLTAREVAKVEEWKLELPG